MTNQQSHLGPDCVCVRQPCRAAATTALRREWQHRVYLAVAFDSLTLATVTPVQCEPCTLPDICSSLAQQLQTGRGRKIVTLCRSTVVL